jgi:hypothetical protein
VCYLIQFYNLVGIHVSSLIFVFENGFYRAISQLKSEMLDVMQNSFQAKHTNEIIFIEDFF